MRCDSNGNGKCKSSSSRSKSRSKSGAWVGVMREHGGSSNAQGEALEASDLIDGPGYHHPLFLAGTSRQKPDLLWGLWTNVGIPGLGLGRLGPIA